MYLFTCGREVLTFPLNKRWQIAGVRFHPVCPAAPEPHRVMVWLPPSGEGFIAVGPAFTRRAVGHEIAGETGCVRLG